MRMICLKLRFFLILLSFTTVLHAQEPPKEFKALVDSLVQAGPRSYSQINTPMRPYRRDANLMKYFAAVCEEKRYLDGLSYAYNQEGTRLRNISQYEEAIEFHKKALEAANTADNVEFRIFSLNMLGVVYRRMESIKTALDYSTEALELANRIDNPSVGIKRSKNVSLNSIGNIFKTLEQYDKAIEHFGLSLKLEAELGNTRGMAVNNQNLGECLEAKGMLEQALVRYRKALEYDIEIGSISGQAICRLSIGRVLIKQGNPEASLPLLAEAEQQARGTKDQQIISEILINQGWAAVKLNRLDTAEDLLLQGIEIGEELNFFSDLSTAYALLSEIAERRGDHKASLEYYKTSEDYSHRVTNDVNIRYVNDVLQRYNNDQQNNQIELLNRENEIVKLKLRRNKTTLLVGALMLVMFTLILYIVYRQYQLKSEKKVMALEQSMLRSQMNPHFLFNSLNSIKLYIINNEQKNAVHYLNKFSKLVRKILEASSVRETSLEEELETIELYMNIENIRFNHEIDFEIVVDPEVNPASIRIPSLLLQPFLENALWHGLSSKKGNKTLRVNVEAPEKGSILITICDNGIGREAAQKLQENKVLKRKSVGIANTKERLANFSKDYQNRFDVSINDLYGETGEASGTCVSLKIPTL
ncbi:Tetratricopeptide repeat-containing protein [Robiginitalea myxolifaciens]|uniref:Tetratricopeptide repeat-containing protein n=1 Tax=Robiginitalea myxolifaciens TaxID=400055 RepID=A0A1I6FZM3_9FLAO|nr:tetratricopeptide repeat protein [Robiginitalea myxolifaciens]SFR35364.1 Tetratricopeptide repeat-containing protein [Robiginitalea myxolifaciens]